MVTLEEAEELKKRIGKYPIDVDEEIEDFITQAEEKVDEIDVVRPEGEEIHILGKKKLEERLFLYEITKNRESEEIEESSDEITPYIFETFANEMDKRIKQDFEKKVEEYQEKNKEEAREKTNKIKIYQGDIEEIEKQTGRKLEIVDTGERRNYLIGYPKTMSTLTCLMGGDVVVHYDGKRGTPARFVD